MLRTLLGGCCLLSAWGLAAEPPTDFSIPSARHIFENTLNATLKFWTAPEVVDAEGGFHAWFDAEGKRIAPEPSSPTASEAGKPLLVQLRILYAHAVAIPRTADPVERTRLRHQYDHGFAFLEKYRDPGTGLFITSVNGGGTPYNPAVQAISQIYAVYILSEVAEEISDHRALELARDTFEKFDRLFHDPVHGGYFEQSERSAAAPETLRKSVGSNMHAALALARLLRVDPNGKVRERLSELFDILTSDRILYPNGNGHMMMNADWTPVKVSGPSTRQVLYGHNAELVWYLLEAAEMLRISPRSMIPWLKKVSGSIIRYGILPDGTAAIFGPGEGKAEPVDVIRWWIQAEQMNMLLRLYDVTGETEYYQLFEKVARRTYELLSGPGGVWYGGVDPHSGKRYYLGGWSWKSGLHVIRSMRLLNRSLDRLKDGWKPPREFRSGLPQRPIQVSLGFPYNRNRSAESLVSELQVNGYDGAFLIIKEREIHPEGLVETARRAGLQVWGSFFGPGTFMPDSLFGPESREWRMQFTVKRPNRYFSYVHPEYREWWKKFLGALYDRHPFTGFVFYESYYGTRAGRLAGGSPPWFGDISPGFVRHFQQTTGHDRFPNFTDPTSPDYYRTNRGLYRDYVEYRVKSVADFHREIWDGNDGLRRKHPEVIFGTWTIALAGDDSARAEMREFEAQDGVRMVTELQPDFHFLQSHWPDWMPEKQTPAYLDGYRPYIRSIREVYPDLQLAVQGDFASTLPFRRSPEWVAEFERKCRETGFQFPTFYEFSVRHAVYYSAPRAVSGELKPDGQGKVVFDQVIDPESVKKLEGLDLGGGRKISAVTTDGNWLLFRVEGDLGAPVSIPLGGITDCPALRTPMPEHGQGKANAIPEGTMQLLKQETSSGNR